MPRRKKLLCRRKLPSSRTGRGVMGLDKYQSQSWQTGEVLGYRNLDGNIHPDFYDVVKESKTTEMNPGRILTNNFTDLLHVWLLPPQGFYTKAYSNMSKSLMRMTLSNAPWRKLVASCWPQGPKGEGKWRDDLCQLQGELEGCGELVLVCSALLRAVDFVTT